MLDENLAGVRDQRASLRQAFAATEQALAAPMIGRPEHWHTQLTGCVDQLCSAWERHVATTEGDDGLFAQIRHDAPQLAPRLRKLHSEHEKIGSELDDLRAALTDHATVDELSRARSRATAALSDVMRHRQRGADLIYEAYQVDIGGE